MGRRVFARTGALAPVLLATLGILAAILAVRLNLGAAQAATPPPSPTHLSDPTSDLLPSIELPDYSPSPYEGVSRRVNVDTQIDHRSRIDILRYTVQNGDSVFGIAERFEIKPETVLWGNFEVLDDDPHLLRPGQELNILPVDGTYHQWQSEDSIDRIADFFGVGPESIVEWPGNGIDFTNPEVEQGNWIVIPGGRRAFKQWFVPTIARGQAGVGAAYGPGGCSGTYSGAVGTGGFIWPAANHYVSGNDYWSGHLAIDIAAGTGASIWAADSGVVVFAGWSTVGYGNMVMIDHGNGWQTVYGHLNSVGVSCGQSVSQGQKIGTSGSTGNSTGPHLHFETRYDGGFVNPWFVLP